MFMNTCAHVGACARTHTPKKSETQYKMIVIKRQGKLETGKVLPALQDTLEELFKVEVYFGVTKHVTQ